MKIKESDKVDDKHDHKMTFERILLKFDRMHKVINLTKKVCNPILLYT